MRALREALARTPFVLAPMSGITDTIYRQMMRAMGAGVVVSELVSCHGILQGNRRTLDLLRFDECERPVGIQVFGDDPQVLGSAARAVEALGPDFVDLNLGCPVPKVVSKGGGAAMLKDPARLETVLRSMRRHFSIPLSVKIRAGWDSGSITAPDCVRAASEAGCLWVAIHGRTREQGYSGLPDWELIRQCKQVSGIPVIGNGDVTSARQAVGHLVEGDCDAVMIGRGALRNPWIFAEARARFEALAPVLGDGAPGVPTPPAAHGGGSSRFLDLLAVHCRLLSANPWYANPLLHMRKFAAWYSHGYPGSAAFRREVFVAPTIDAVFDLARRFFEPLADVPVEAKDEALFMRSGHG